MVDSFYRSSYPEASLAVVEVVLVGAFAIWIRGLLQHEYGVDLTKIRWVQGALRKAGAHGSPTVAPLLKPPPITAQWKCSRARGATCPVVDRPPAASAAPQRGYENLSIPTHSSRPETP